MQEVVQEMITFAVVNREGSLTAAARSLGKSKGYVSTQIARLETFLGAKLLYRSTRRMALTNTGTLFLPHCEALLERLHQAQQTLQDSHEQMTGEVRLTLPMSFAKHAIHTWLPEFKALYPSLSVNVTLSNTAFDLEDHPFDLAIRAANHVANLDYVSVHLATFCYGLFASKDYLEEHGRPMEISELAVHQGILHSEVDHLDAWQLMDANTPVAIRPKVGCLFNSAEACLHAAQAGLGIARLPEYLAQDSDLEAVLSHYRSEPIAVQLVYPYQGQQPKRVRALIEFLKQKRALVL